MDRIDKINYYLDIAETVLERGTCLRRNFGAIIVNNDQIVSTGYTGAPRGRKIAVIWDFVSVRNAIFPVASVMNFAEAFTPRRTLLFMHQENR